MHNCKIFNPFVLERNYLGKRNLCDVTNMQLHGYADSSGKAYACVIYLRTLFDNGEVLTTFIASKSRVAPIKKITIPRLELMGVVIGCRMIKFVSDQLKINLEKSILFTDSKYVVEWTKTKKSLRRFTGDRVKEIVESGTQVSYVKAEDNPADVGQEGQQLIN